MARSTYTFGGHSFSSRDKVRRWMGEIRAAYSPGETITDSAHVRAVTDLLQCHVDRAQKIGAGIKRLFVDYAPDHPSLCFWVERADGVTTDFGVPSCLRGIGTLNRQSFRQIIRPVIEDFKRTRIGNSVTFVSDFSGITFSISVAHVDHEVPFDDIIAQFAELEGFSVETHLLTVSRDACSLPVWLDHALPARFLDHHASYPLRLVHQRENLSDIKLARKVL
jgi:Protein of unknown function (DUF3223)